MVTAINRPKLWRIDMLNVKLYRCVIIFVRSDFAGSIGLLRASVGYSAQTDPVLRPGNTTWRLRPIYIAITGITGNLNNEANKLENCQKRA